MNKGRFRSREESATAKKSGATSNADIVNRIPGPRAFTGRLPNHVAVQLSPEFTKQLVGDEGAKERLASEIEAKCPGYEVEVGSVYGSGTPAKSYVSIDLIKIADTPSEVITTFEANKLKFAAGDTAHIPLTEGLTRRLIDDDAARNKIISELKRRNPEYEFEFVSVHPTYLKGGGDLNLEITEKIPKTSSELTAIVETKTLDKIGGILEIPITPGLAKRLEGNKAAQRKIIRELEKSHPGYEFELNSIEDVGSATFHIRKVADSQSEVISAFEATDIYVGGDVSMPISPEFAEELRYDDGAQADIVGELQKKHPGYDFTLEGLTTKRGEKYIDFNVTEIAETQYGIVKEIEAMDLSTGHVAMPITPRLSDELVHDGLARDRLISALETEYPGYKFELGNLYSVGRIPPNVQNYISFEVKKTSGRG